MKSNSYYDSGAVSPVYLTDFVDNFEDDNQYDAVMPVTEFDIYDWF